MAPVISVSSRNHWKRYLSGVRFQVPRVTLTVRPYLSTPSISISLRSCSAVGAADARAAGAAVDERDGARRSVRTSAEQQRACAAP